MAVQVWIGEKPEHPNERRAIVALANGLERLDGLYLILANFSVGGRTIDLVIIKQDAIFIIELKHCDGKVFGDVNGPWFVESANGVRKRLNPGRKNPYNQVVSYYYSLINFLNEQRAAFLSPNKAQTIDFRTCRRVVVIAPTLHPESQVEIDWKVDLKGLDGLPVYLVTERSSEINLTDEEMLAIPELLHCTRWREVNELIAGVLPEWDKVTADPQPPAPAVQEAPLPTVTTEPPQVIQESAPPFRARFNAVFQTWPGRIAAGLAVLSLALALLLVFRSPAIPAPDQSSAPLLGTSEVGPAAGGVNPPGNVGQPGCTWSGFQAIGRRRSGTNWSKAGIFDSAPALAPDVVVILERVDFCNGRVALTWSVQNNLTDETISMPLNSQNIAVRDVHGNQYTIADAESSPAQISVAPQEKGSGKAIIDHAVSLDATTLLITLKQQPFGEAVYIVSVPEGR